MAGVENAEHKLTKYKEYLQPKLAVPKMDKDLAWPSMMKKKTKHKYENTDI